ncbi:MAG: arginine deiminase-related protein [Bacteroidota bacterium]
MLRAQFEQTQKEIVEISLEQMGAFAGNMLQVQSQSGDPILVLSKTAYDSLLPEQIQQLEKHTRLLSPDIPTIEQYGGGSVRCMMAEIFLPLRAQ